MPAASPFTRLERTPAERTLVAGAVSTAALAKELAGPGAGAAAQGAVDEYALAFSEADEMRAAAEGMVFPSKEAPGE